MTKVLFVFKQPINNSVDFLSLGGNFGEQFSMTISTVRNLVFFKEEMYVF